MLNSFRYLSANISRFIWWIALYTECYSASDDLMHHSYHAASNHNDNMSILWTIQCESN